MANLVGGVELNIITDLTKLPQRIASAMAELENPERCGATFKALLYYGKQVVRGVNYCFIAEETLILAKPEKHLVSVAVNEFNGEYEIVKSSIIKIV